MQEDAAMKQKPNLRHKRKAQPHSHDESVVHIMEEYGRIRKIAK